MRKLTEEYGGLLSAQETAEAAGVAKQTVLNYMKDGRITPSLELPSGQCFFDEDAVVTLLVLSFSKEYKDNTLAVCIGGSDACQSFSEEYDSYLKNRGIPRVDNLAGYLTDCRKRLRLNKPSQRLYITQAVETTIRSCEREVKKLSRDLQNHILFHPHIEDVAVFAEHRDSLLDAEKIIPRLNGSDREIYETGIYLYREKRESVEERYAVRDMSSLAKILNSGEWEQVTKYKPSKPVVRAIWRKVEQRHLRECLKSHMKQHFRQGYVSVLSLNPQNDRCLYELVSKALDPCIRRIEVYCLDEIPQEIHQVLDGVQEYKDIVYKSEL